MPRYPFVDRSPCITAAGKVLADPDEQARSCLTNVPLQEKVDVLKQQYKFVEPRDYGPNLKPKIEPPGVFSEIRHCLMLPSKTQFQCLEEEVKSTVYNSYWNQPVGKCRDPTPNLPRGVDIYRSTFGKASDEYTSGKDLIRPDKTSGQVVYEDKACHDLYRFSHENYWPGEQIKRCYQLPFNKHRAYGAMQKLDDSGINVKRCMAWFNNDPITFVSRRQAAMRNKTVAPLGKNVDKTGVTEMIPPGATFGRSTAQGFYGVADLLNECMPSLLRRDMLTFLSAANKMRQSVAKKINEGELILEEVYQELLALDQDKTCVLHFDCIVKVCNKHRIVLDRSKIEPLLLILGILGTDGFISYRKFIDFVNFNSPFPELKKEHFVMPPEFQSYDKKYQQEQPDPICACTPHLKTPAGVATVRTDNSFPSYKYSKAEVDNLGDETTVRSVLSPSIFSQYGLTHRDFFKPRSKRFLWNLFRKIGVELTAEDVDAIYGEGAAMDNTGGVCVETFRNILDSRAYKSYMRI